MVDLSKNRQYVQSYVDLRNKYIPELMTRPVTAEGTNKWLDDKKCGTLHVVVENEKVVAAVVLRGRGEVTVFSEKKGMGEELVKEAEKMAYEMGLDRIWAKVKIGNDKSENLFLRSGYEKQAHVFFKNIHYGQEFGFRKGAEAFPLMIILSMTYVCNSRCPACVYTSQPELRSKHKDAKYITDDLFKKIADECGPHGTLLRLCGGGEPFLHKNLIPFAKYAKDKGCKVNIITNGSLDVTEAIDVVDMIEFSVDAGNEEEYKKIRVGLDWKFLNENVRNAMKLRTKTRLICSIVNQVGVDMERAKEHWGFLDAVQVRKFLTYNGDVKDRSANTTPFLPPEQRIPCPWLFDRTCIDTHGDFIYCGCDLHCNYVIGNIKERSIADVWLGKEYQYIRDMHLSRRGDQVELCKTCDDWKNRTWNFSFWELEKYASGNPTA